MKFLVLFSVFIVGALFMGCTQAKTVTDVAPGGSTLIGTVAPTVDASVPADVPKPPTDSEVAGADASTMPGDDAGGVPELPGDDLPPAPN